MAEAFQILTRQPRNQVQMLMDVMPFIDCAGNTAYLVYVSLATYGLKRVRIGGLDANLQLCLLYTSYLRLWYSEGDFP